MECSISAAGVYGERGGGEPIYSEYKQSASTTTAAAAARTTITRNAVTATAQAIKIRQAKGEKEWETKRDKEGERNGKHEQLTRSKDNQWQQAELQVSS